MSNPYANLTPLNDRVIIEPIAEKAERVVGGIIIPQNSGKGSQSRGLVVACGAGRFEYGFRVPMTVKVGDEVIFNPYTGSEIEVGATKLVMLHEHEISCVIKKQGS